MMSVPPRPSGMPGAPQQRRDNDDVDLLLRQNAPGEFAAARALLPQGLGVLVQRAHEALGRAEMWRQGFAAVSRSLEQPGAPHGAIVEKYLRETSTDRKKLEDDLLHLKRRPGKVFDLPALGERAVKAAMKEEIKAEVAMAVAVEAVNQQSVRSLPIFPIIELAQVAGRWSRRVWALRLLREVVKTIQAPAPIPEIVEVCRRLLKRDEHRWVQPAALALLAETSDAEALRAATERFSQPGPGDDFLVRERMVSFAGRRGGAWRTVVALASKDKSEHVRLTAVRALDDFGPVAEIAEKDASHRVRAQALITLSQRWAHRSEAALARALTQDKHAITVRTAAEQLVQLAKEHKLKSRVTALEALTEAAQRKELNAEQRERVAESLLTVDVLTDPPLATIWQLLTQVVEKVPVGSGVRIGGPAFTQATGEGLARVLSVLSQNDFPLAADRVRDGIIVYRGEPRRFAMWRFIFEVLHPTPSKRQGYVHSWARAPRGSLRAPPGGLAEITATQVPGERVLVSSGGWGRSLPMMDDVVSTLTTFGKPALLVSSTGVTSVIPPTDPMSRLAARAKVAFIYPKLANLRKRSLDSDEPLVQTAFATELQKQLGVRIEYTPLAFGPRALRVPAPPQILPTPQRGNMVGVPNAAQGVLPFVAAAAVPAQKMIREFTAYASSMHENRLPHVAAYASLILVGMLARGAVIRRAIDKDRKAIPLVLGGWGTRGKSGTERIKAGMLQGLGYETLTKTTGCEAMFIHALPEIAAKEVFIYRPYDKATIWEQRGLLSLGAQLGIHTFLWECMALQPDLVNLLQAQWMRDDYSTITNAYPDHEDVQGPAGFDVATTISEFVPVKGRLFTSEDQMLPIIREKARGRGTSCKVVEHRESDLIAEDMLARFPYHEHPRNIALVAALGRGLGVTPAVSIAEMADNVVPDLGVLKTYGTIEHEGRTIDFTNGCSANERTGAWSNWVRMGFNTHDPDKEPKKYIVTVVNNRGDRIARSEVFARFLVEDAAAHRHVLIGSNVTGLYGFIKAALENHLKKIALTVDLAGTPDERHRTARARLAKALGFLKIASPTADSVMAEIAAMKMPPLDPAMISGLLLPSQPGETVAESKRVVGAALGAQGPFVVEMVSRRRAAKALEMAVDQLLHTAPARLDQVFHDAYIELFMDGILPLYDYGLTGDQIIDKIAKLVPPGANAAVMGVQNIKGTGLDFVYRWVSCDLTFKAIAKIENGTPTEKEQGLKDLMVHDDYGLMDAKQVLARLEQLSQRSPGTYDALMNRLREIVKKRSSALTASRAETAGDKFRKFIGKTFDYMHSIKRQSQAKQVVEDLVAGRISHAAAAIQMRDVVASAKGNWMKRK